MQKSYQFGSGFTADPLWVRFGSVLLFGNERKPFTATNQMDFHNQALDRYEAQLDQQIEVNNGVTLCVTAYEKDGTERWTACCLDAEELPRGNDRGPARWPQVRTDHDTELIRITDRLKLQAALANKHSVIRSEWDAVSVANVEDPSTSFECVKNYDCKSEIGTTKQKPDGSQP